MMTAWCPTCRTRREVMDTYETDTGDRVPVFSAYVAMPLECGHDANDGGATPPRHPGTTDPDLVARLVALQAGAQSLSLRDSSAWAALATLAGGQ